MQRSEASRAQRAWWLVCSLVVAGGCATGEKGRGPSSGVQGDTLHPLAALTPSMQASEEEKAMLIKTNAFRRDRGLSLLRPESRLMATARRHAGNMARKDRFGDTGTNGHVMDGMDSGDRVQWGGYAFALLAENVGWQLGHPDPVHAMVEGWLRSSGHLKNLLSADLMETGVGAAQGKSGRWYFVQMFAKPYEGSRRASARMVAGTSLQP